LLLIIGLGNPGAAYQATRHNVGFMLVDRLSESCGIKCDMPGWKSCWGRGSLAGTDVVLVKPQTFMNLSGEAVAWFTGALTVDAGSVLVAYDDSDLALGRLRIKRGGGSGGHKGIESVAAALGTNDFPRLRLGIGRPSEGDLTDYVLSPFAVDEGESVEEMLTRAADSIEVIIAEGMDSAMNRFNANE
jgi:PTH1 family peptidyl-tRNA hydrolase